MVPARPRSVRPVVALGLTLALILAGSPSGAQGQDAPDPGAAAKAVAATGAVLQSIHATTTPVVRDDRGLDVRRAVGHRPATATTTTAARTTDADTAPDRSPGSSAPAPNSRPPARRRSRRPHPVRRSRADPRRPRPTAVATMSGSRRSGSIARSAGSPARRRRTRATASIGGAAPAGTTSISSGTPTACSSRSMTPTSAIASRRA